MFKAHIKLFCLIFLSAVFAVFYFFYEPDEFHHFSYLCSIYNKDNKLVESIPNYVFCDYSSDGKTIASNPFKGELTLFNKNTEKVWTSKEFIHHDVKFSTDEKTILLISSEIINYENAQVRSDCVSQRDLNNLIIHEWCLKDHITELSKLGFNMSKRPFKNNFTGEKVAFEITHTNSIYEIPENVTSKNNAAFSKGNFIVNLYGRTGALIILDKQMKSILWSLNFFDFTLDNLKYSAHTHDIQVLSNGNILAYFNSFNYNLSALTSFANEIFQINDRIFQYKKNQPHSMLVEFDPIQKEIKWRYEDSPPEEFFSKTNGTVTKLDTNYVYSTLSASGGEFIEINSEGKKLWSFQNTQVDAATGKPVILIKAKPLKSLDYLDAKNLLD
ncbi:MAG: hypothetical protein ABL930_03675 [Pseudobdellovibrio sp.]